MSKFVDVEKLIEALEDEGADVQPEWSGDEWGYSISLIKETINKVTGTCKTEYPNQIKPPVDIMDLVDSVCFYTKKELSPIRVSNIIYLLQSATLSWHMCPLVDVSFKKKDGVGVLLEHKDKVLTIEKIDTWCYRTITPKTASDIIQKTFSWNPWIGQLVSGYNRFSTKQIIDIVENTRTVSKFKDGDIITTMDIWRSLNE